MSDYTKTLITVWASIATILGTCVATIALIPAFGQWLLPKAATSSEMPQAVTTTIPQESGYTQIEAFPAGIPVFLYEKRKSYSMNWEFPYDRTVDVIDVYVRCLSCTPVEDYRVTNSTGEYDYPVWSPDGTMLLAVDGARCNFREETRMLLMSADGSWEREMEGVKSLCVGYSWSPNGEEIAYPATNGSLMAVALRDGKMRKIVDAAMFPENVTWSPDGQSLAFMVRFDSVNDERGWRIWIVEADGSNLRLLPEEDANYGNMSPYWSLDSTHLIYNRFSIDTNNERGPIELWSYHIDSQVQERIDQASVRDEYYYPTTGQCYDLEYCGSGPWNPE